MARPIRIDVPASPTPALGWLTALNIGVFVMWQVAYGLIGDVGAALMSTAFTTSADLVLSGAVWTLLGSAISHASFEHLFFNLFAMWLFGRDVERVVGSWGFVHLYVAGGVVASLGHVLFNLWSGIPVPALGASGSVMAIAVVSAMLYPNRLLLLFFFIPMRQITAVGLFVLMDLFGLLSPGRDAIAHGAHLGGALYGWLYYRHRLRHYLADQLATWRRQRARRGGQGSPWDHPMA